MTGLNFRRNEPHHFQQLVGVSVRVCRICSKWPGHHVHIGESTAWCACDVCRGLRGLVGVRGPGDGMPDLQKFFRGLLLARGLRPIEVREVSPATATDGPVVMIRAERFMTSGQPFNFTDFLAEHADRLGWNDLPDPDPDAKPIEVHKAVAWMPVSGWDLMDAGLIPDTRPPAPKPTRRQRFRGWRREKTSQARRWIGLWIAGIDADELNDREE